MEIHYLCTELTEEKMKHERFCIGLCLAVALTACADSRKKIDQYSKLYAAGQPTEVSAPEKQVETRPVDNLEVPAPIRGVKEQILRREGYITSYNQDTKQPNWVAWHLTADHTTGPYKREGIKFHEDEDVPEPRVVDWDYARSGYDRGHMCPSGDNKWSRLAQEQSFLFTNICPQNGGLNRGDWNEMENQCRRWAKRYGDIYIVAGPIFYKGKHKTIGQHKVVVPDAFFKVVLCMQGTPKAIAFIYKNVEGNRPKDSYVNSVDDVERITGIDFFPALPDDVEQRVESQHCLSDWQ